MSALGRRVWLMLDQPLADRRIGPDTRLAARPEAISCALCYPLAHLDERDLVPLEEGRSLRACLEARDFAGFADQLKAWLSGIPYQWHIRNDLARYEAWYASLLQMCFRAIGVEVHAEESSSHGRADMVVRLGEQVFVFEFKMAESCDDAEPALEEALSQMQERGYADKYRPQSTYLVAVACGREARNLLEVKAVSVSQ